MVKNAVGDADVDRILRQHVWLAMGVGLVPLPLVDLVAISGVQLNMLRKIANAYRVPFLQDAVKHALSALLGAALPITAAPGVIVSLSKLIPGMGQTVGVMTMPALAGASTYAVGKVFARHFASGGTFLTFDPSRVHGLYRQMFKEGQQFADDIRHNRTAPNDRNRK